MALYRSAQLRNRQPVDRRNVESLGLEGFEHRRADDAGGAPCSQHEAIDFADTCRTEGIGGKRRHSGESAAVAGQQVAGDDDKQIVVGDLAHGHQQVNDGLCSKHDQEHHPTADVVGNLGPEQTAEGYVKYFENQSLMKKKRR